MILPSAKQEKQKRERDSENYKNSKVKEGVIVSTALLWMEVKAVTVHQSDLT